MNVVNWFVALFFAGICAVFGLRFIFIDNIMWLGGLFVVSGLLVACIALFELSKWIIPEDKKSV